MTPSARHEHAETADQAADGTPRQPPDRRVRGPRRPVWMVLVALGSVLLGGAAGAVAGRLSAPDERPLPSASGRPLAAMLPKVSRSVVDIETTALSPGGPATYAGSGFVLRRDGLIATSAHLVEDGGATTVTFGDATTVIGTVVGISERYDLAVVRVPRRGLTPLSFADSGSLRVGDPAIVVGNALALAGGPTVSMGIVSALDRSITTGHGRLSGLIQTSAGISSGDSGGPLVDSSGRVVGISTAAASGGGETVAENIGFAIPSNPAEQALHDLSGG